MKSISKRWSILGLVMALGIPGSPVDRHQQLCAAGPAGEEVAATLQRAVDFFSKQASTHGGYVWLYSSDLKHRQGEGLAYDQRIWIQPPGTPAVGLAILAAYEATGESTYLEAARAAAEALVKGQLHSGGWPYSVSFDPRQRRLVNYRVAPTKGPPQKSSSADSLGGWQQWRQRKHKSNITVLDDNTTQSALKFLMHVDQALDFKHDTIHESVQYGLKSLIRAQYPIGAWSHNYDRFPDISPDPGYYPIRPASFPDKWSRTWTKNYDGCYVINDRITLDAIKTLIDAYEIYESSEYFEAANRGGEFLLRAQLPEPQPAWAQQYDRHMHPVWDRPFEPPAVCGFESQTVIETLLLLYQRTGKKEFLDAVPPALTYLRRCRLFDGKLARYYELSTNRPLYFTKNYALTHERGEMPDHYQFVVNSNLDAIALQYRTLARGGPTAKMPTPTREELAEEARILVQTMDQRGAWTEPGFVRDADGKKVFPEDGIIRSETFIRNVEVLSQYLSMLK